MGWETSSNLPRYVDCINYLYKTAYGCYNNCEIVRLRSGGMKAVLPT